MSATRFRRLLLPAVTSFAVLVPAGMAAAACRPLPPPPCRPTAFTGSVGAHATRCIVRTAPVCRDRRGPRGVRGHTGARGRRGAVGHLGSTGVTGSTGVAGSTGATGSNGATGAAGSQGPTGSQGASGSQGLQGVQGAVGATGAIGAPGTDGTNGAPGIDGTNGAPGTDGAPGADGTDGAPGIDGTTGAPGIDGAPGADGTDGLQGVRGDTGADGSQGVQGTPGIDGADGTDGAPGTDGAQGPPGDTGPAGDAGPPGASGLTEYAYVYNLAAQTVPIEADVNFDSNGVLTAGFTHAPGTSQIQIVNAGDYRISYSVSGTEPSQFAVYLNGSGVAGTVYGSGAGTQQSTGQAIIQAGAGDVLTVRNHTSSAAVGLATPIGGTQANANASVVIEKLN
ncbi:MAG: hypothetical protein QOE65_605 [Solirubrobacteraceae bacterium]|nr:hypothetical protein [Solirubrobacteraceae bacterium]